MAKQSGFILSKDLEQKTTYNVPKLNMPVSNNNNKVTTTVKPLITKTTSDAEKEKAGRTAMETARLKEIEKTKPIVATSQTKPKVAYGTKGSLPSDIPRVANPFTKLVDTAALGLPSNLVPGYKEMTQQAEKQFPVTSTVAGVGGYFVPGAIGAKAIKPLLTGVKAGVKKNIVEGAVVGSGITAAENIVPLIKGEKNLGQVGKEIATGAVLGAAADLGLGAIGKLAKPLINKIQLGKALSLDERAIVAKTMNVPTNQVDSAIEKARVSLTRGDLLTQPVKKVVLTSEPIKPTAINEFTQPQIKPTQSPQVNVKPLLDTNIEQPIKTLPSVIVEPTKPVTSVAFNIPKPKQETLEISLPNPNIKPPKVDTGQGTAESLRERIVTDVKKPKKSFDEIWKKAESQFIDDTAPLKHLEKKVTGSVASAEKSIYKTAALYKGAPERANEIIRTELKPAIQMAEKAGYDHNDLRDYAIAVHAKEVNEAGINSGIETSAAEDTIRKFGTPEMESARQQLMKVSNNLVDDMYNNGLLTKESYEGLKNKWKNYMPLFREFDDEMVSQSFGMSDKLGGASAPIKGLLGSDRKVLDPLQSMVKNIYATQSAIAKNKVGLQLANLSDIDAENKFIRKLDKDEPVGRKNVVNVKIDGKKVAYEVEPEVYKMFEGLDKESSNWIMDALAKPASVLRSGATLTPEFALRNPMRDVMNAYVVSKSNFNPFIDFPKGLASVMKKDEHYSQFLKENGGFGNIMSMDRQAHKEAIEKIIKQPPSKKFVNIINPNTYIDLLRSISDVTESATKVGEFRKAISKGETPQEAAYRARNLMDFGKAGSSIRPANRVVSFLNANIRGKSTLIEAIKENPLKTSAKIMQSMVLPSVAFKMYTAEYGNEEQKRTIKDAPTWLKDTFWLVPVPNSDIVARIPKPFDIAAAANATERFIDYTAGKDEEAFKGFAKDTIKGQSIPVMITGILPILEAMSNYSQFKQGPIIPEREKFLPRKYQSDSKTSELAKIAAGGIGKVVGEESNFSSPRTIDYVIRSSTGGLGSTALDAMDWLAKSTGLVKRPPKPSVGVTGLPIVKGFTVNELSTGKSMGDLYDLKNKLMVEKGGVKYEAKKKGDDPKDVKFEKEKAYKFVNNATEEIGEITKEMREITEDMNMSPEEKRKKLKELNDKRNKLSLDALLKSKELLKNAQYKSQ